VNWRRRILLILGVVALLVQFYGLYSPSGPPSTPGMPSDKIEHLLGFAVPVALFIAARVDWRLVAGLAVLQAIASELVQGLLLSDRSGDLWDIVADLTGTAIGCVVGWFARRFTADRPSATASPTEFSRDAS